MNVARQAGVTLVELVIAIVVIAIAVGVVLGTLASGAGASADPMIRQQAIAAAAAYMEEILLRSFDDPDGVDGEAARSDFDDVDDYDGLLDVGVRDQFGNPVAQLAAYTVSVAVVPSAALPGVASSDALRVDVNVTHTADVSFALSGYRTRL